MSITHAIEVVGLVKKYGSKTAVDGIDLKVETGEIFALLGPNGAGKTTTVEILEGYRKASGGQVRVLGFDPATKGSAGQRWRNRIGIVLQSTTDAADLSVIETISHYANYYENPRDVEQVIDEVKCFLWKGEVDAAISCFEGWSEPQVENFIIYLNKHKHRIVNYGYLQAEGISIGSGSVESKKELNKIKEWSFI